MARARWITLLWPGLTQLWLHGAWWGLALACCFAWLFCLAVVSTFVWSEWIEPGQRTGLWVLIAGVWCGAAVVSLRHLSTLAGPADAAGVEDLFRRARSEYLTGNWIKAEQLLTHLIRINQKDVDAQLMLASLLRRAGQRTEATQQLRRLEATDGAEKWVAEIRRERQLLEQQNEQHHVEDNAESNQSTPTIENDPANQAA